MAGMVGLRGCAMEDAVRKVEAGKDRLGPTWLGGVGRVEAGKDGTGVSGCGADSSGMDCEAGKVRSDKV